MNRRSNIQWLLMISLIVLITIFSLSSFPHASADNWALVCTDSNDFPDPNLKAVYYKVDDGILYFKVTFYGDISSINDFDVGILVDVDKNVNTGFDVDMYPGADTNLGAEYLIITGWEVPWVLPGFNSVMVRNSSSSSWDTGNPITPDYYRLDTDKNMFVIGYKLSKFSRIGDSVKVATLDVTPSGWDYCPDSGNILLYLRPYILDVSGVSSRGLATLTLTKDSGMLKVYPYLGLNSKTYFQFDLKVVSITETGSFTYINVLINYNANKYQNWVPAKIIVDKRSGMVYLFGPINMMCHL